FLARVVPLKTSEGGAVASHSEITRLKQAEQSSRESDARFRTVADTAPVMIWMSGPDKEGIFFNKGWLEFTGRTADEEMGEGWLKGVHPEDVAHCLEVCGGAFAKREPFTVEYRLRRHDGEYRWLLDTGTPRFDAEGVFLGYIGSCIDIGERKQAELDHQLQNTELARVGRVALMGELAASLAHEINNPVGAMVANASAGQRLLARGKLGTTELQELLADIVSDGHRAREVIEGIRNMVRKSEASYARVPISEIITDLARIIRADAIARKISLVTEVDDRAGVVLGDRVQLLQVLLNLTMNAFESLGVVRAEARRVVVRVGPVEEGKICVGVRDTGPGFPDGIVEQLFEPFFSTKAEGTGMGLAIARSIVEAHGGTLSGKNHPDGALFTICLPEAR
ncbi:MAG: histidine kinase, partial [Verrucomicrobia bacterium]